MSDSKEKKIIVMRKIRKMLLKKMTECDEKSKDDKERSECYSKVISEDDGCMSS